jgi:nucleoside-diphosphate-sugar epimerase
LAKFIVHSNVQHLIVLGTCAEYGQQIEPCRAGVTSQIPLSLYAKQKVEAYKNANRILQETAVRFTWARIFYPYGPKQDSRRLIPKLIDGIKSGEQIKLKDISSVYDWISSRDIADAIYWTIMHNLPVEIDIGTSIGFTNLQVLTVLKQLLNATNIDDSICEHEYGLNEMFVVSQESPIIRSGWTPRDSLYSGLDWTMNS